MSSNSSDVYYIPDGSYWPFVGSVAVALMLGGFASALHGTTGAAAVSVAGFAMVLFMVFGWIGQVIQESESGVYNAQVDRSFRMGMMWFIFSEVMFFGAFFGALFYARMLSVPWLDGEGNNVFTHMYLWPDFKAVWPLVSPPDAASFSVPTALVSAFGIPAINTGLLLSSGVTVTIAHWALKENNRGLLIGSMIATILLGVVFLGFQAVEYGHAFSMGLTLESGIYGSTFYLLTGFHGFHVTLGILMLTVILMRILRGHFTKDKHFAFEAVAWYWHFVDVVWLGLFIFVYWI